MATNTDFLQELTWRGCLQAQTPGAADLLRTGTQTAYIGADPTGPSLHIGHLATLLKLAHFQRAGHRPILLVGGATGMVGDPSGRSSERNLLTLEQVRDNAERIRNQMAHFVDFDPARPNGAIMVDNYDWFREFNLLDFLRTIGKHFTVNYMLAKESVANRMEDGISFTEFSYQLLQAYDFYQLNQRHGCRLQMGGSDQWGNIVSGIELIRRMGGTESHAITFPLVTRADGTKFGKTATGQSVWLDAEMTSPYQFFQFWLNQEDTQVDRLLKNFSFKTEDEVAELVAAHTARPGDRLGQRALAEEITIRVHGEAALEGIRHASGLLFGKGGAEDLKTLSVRQLEEMGGEIAAAKLPIERLKDGLNVIDLFVETGAAETKSKARTLLQQGGLRINKVPIKDLNLNVSTEDLLHNRWLLLQSGKKDYTLVSFQ